jgi:hypothetical protein
MKNIKCLLSLAVLGFSIGLHAVQKVGFINNSGQDLFARIRTQRSEHNVMVIHPTLNQDPHGVLNPIPNNPEVFLLKDKGVVFVSTHRLGRDLRARVWKTDYVPTADDMTLTSAENKANSLTSKMIKVADLHNIQSQLLIYSINSDNAERPFHRVSSDSYAQKLANNEFAYVMDLEATEYSEIYGKVSLPNEYQSLT